MSSLQDALKDLKSNTMSRRAGFVRAVSGLAIEASDLKARVGELCVIGEGRGSSALAEVVAVREGSVMLMPFAGVHGLAAGDIVSALDGMDDSVAVGDGMLGRVIDSFGNPLDGRGPIDDLPARRAVRALPINPMERPRISEVLETGVRAIDALLTIGRGQRVGIFAGSGVGKSTLLGMIARNARADVNVIALIGERGREVKEFIEKQLGEQGLARSVVVVATADQPALSRVRAANLAVAIAEHFRDGGRQVFLTMDSVTRYAMARREIGLSAGEPPTARGYTPSVFAELPVLCERCGTASSGGAITALFTVLVEGDDFNEPISDALRAVLDGHIVLSRDIAHQQIYPAIDILRSASRLMPDLVDDVERSLASRAVQLQSILTRNQQMVELGAYEAGTNPELDAALAAAPALRKWLSQAVGGVERTQAIASLAELLPEDMRASSAAKRSLRAEVLGA